MTDEKKKKKKTTKRKPKAPRTPAKAKITKPKPIPTKKQCGTCKHYSDNHICENPQCPWYTTYRNPTRNCAGWEGKDD